MVASDVLLSVSNLTGNALPWMQTETSGWKLGSRNQGEGHGLFTKQRRHGGKQCLELKCSASPNGGASLFPRNRSWKSLYCEAMGRSPRHVSLVHATLNLPPWNSTLTSGVVRCPQHSDATGTVARGVQSGAFGFRSKTKPVVKEQRPLAEVQEVAGPGSIRIAYVLEQGQREEMEDEISVVADVPGGFVYAGVFDGHVGTATARFLRDDLYGATVAALGNGEMLSAEEMPHAAAAITESFVQFDRRVLSWLEAQEGAERESGSTGTIVFARPDRIFVACVGDARAVLGSNGEPTELSEDHRPFGDGKTAKAEIKRLKDAGCWVSQGRVCGSLAVSRAFGDVMFKSGRKDMLTAGLKKGRWTPRFVERMNLDVEWVTAIPDVYHADLKPEDNLVIVGSDGLWDVVKSSEAVRFVQRKLDEHGDLKRACEELLKFALDRKTSDNVSIVLIELGKQAKEEGQ